MACCSGPPTPAWSWSAATDADAPWPPCWVPRAKTCCTTSPCPWSFAGAAETEPRRRSNREIGYITRRLLGGTCELGVA